MAVCLCLQPLSWFLLSVQVVAWQEKGGEKSSLAATYLRAHLSWSSVCSSRARDEVQALGLKPEWKSGGQFCAGLTSVTRVLLTQMYALLWDICFTLPLLLPTLSQTPFEQEK